MRIAGNISPSTPEQRRDRIRVALDDLAPVVAEAYEARDWEHFGHDTWAAYVTAEFGALRLGRVDRQVAVATMRESGMSTRAIADAVGADQRTVRRDLEGEANAAPDIIGTDGKTYPANRTKPTAPPTGRRRAEPTHPAKYSEVLYAVFDRMLPTVGIVLDPFAGVGGIHRLGTDLRGTIGIELEPEWANQHPRTIIGDALHLPFDDNVIDAICTSPAYGNRMADSYDGDGTTRHTYRIALGRELGATNSGAMHWGSQYREFHTAAWTEAERILKPGGILVLNISDHIRAHVRQPVTAFHVETLIECGLRIVDLESVETPRNRNGANSSARVAHEYVIQFAKPRDEAT